MNFKTLSALAADLQAGGCSAQESVDHAIARIEADGDAINAVVVRDFERARAAAVAADRALAEGDHRPLLGVPITVKEAINVAGLPTTWGTPGTPATPVPEDAVAVQRLMQAGAIVLGKTNVPVQLADWQAFNPIFGTTNNPWDPSRTPGGSSGGAAAALAAGYETLELGSDLNGSLRVPASFCGVYGHKPTQGLVPLRGFSPPGVPVPPYQPDINFGVLGPLARSAGDLEIALRVLVGPEQPASRGYRFELAASRHEALDRFRVLMLTDHPHLPLSKEVRTAMQTFTRRLREAGCTVATESRQVPDLGRTALLYATQLMAFFGADMPDDAYRQMQKAAPAAPADASEGVETSGMVITHRDWVRQERERLALTNEWFGLLAQRDVIVCPVTPTTAFAHDHRPMAQRTLAIDDKAIEYTSQAAWCSIASRAGLPATAMPIGLGSSGLPVGVQALGGYLEDLTTIRFAELCASEFGGAQEPPLRAKK